MKKPAALYLGDGGLDGAARYLYCVLRSAGFDVTHKPGPDGRRSITTRPDLVILSDFPYKGLLREDRQTLSRLMETGSGLLMVGGWASFRGLDGGYGGTDVESFLPVTCERRDDRVQNGVGYFPAVSDKKHVLARGLDFSRSGVLAGLNRVRAKPDARVVLTAHEIQEGLPTPRWDKKGLPLLVVRETKRTRSAALTTDLSPHWCGAFVDWGAERVALGGNRWGAGAEVGDAYVAFVRRLLLWTAGRF